MIWFKDNELGERSGLSKAESTRSPREPSSRLLPFLASVTQHVNRHACVLVPPPRSSAPYPRPCPHSPRPPRNSSQLRPIPSHGHPFVSSPKTRRTTLGATSPRPPLILLDSAWFRCSRLPLSRNSESTILFSFRLAASCSRLARASGFLSRLAFAVSFSSMPLFSLQGLVPLASRYVRAFTDGFEVLGQALVECSFLACLLKCRSFRVSSRLETPLG